MAYLEILGGDDNDNAPAPIADDATPNFEVQPPRYDYVEKGFGEGRLETREPPKNS